MSPYGSLGVSVLLAVKGSGPLPLLSLDLWVHVFYLLEQGHRTMSWPLISGVYCIPKDDTPTSQGVVSKLEPRLCCQQAMGPPVNLTASDQSGMWHDLGTSLVKCHPLPPLAVK